jgi:transcriptional regulator of aromatic amino acid metabolism
VKLNCSGIPTGLLENELFGHERGRAFTGAAGPKVARFELADMGKQFREERGWKVSLFRCPHPARLEKVSPGDSLT